MNLFTKTNSIISEKVVNNESKIVEVKAIIVPMIGNSENQILKNPPDRKGVYVDGEFYSIPPFDRYLQAIWIVKMAFRDLIDSSTYKGLSDSLNAIEKDKVEFFKGMSKGLLECISNEITAYIKSYKELFEGLIGFYKLVYDVSLWEKIFSVWFYDGKIEDIESVVKKEHPQFYNALLMLKKFDTIKENIVGYLKDENILLKLFYKLIDHLKNLLRYDEESGKDRIVEFINLQGQTFNQGQYLGLNVGSFAIIAITTALDIRSFTKSLLNISRQIIVKYPELAEDISKLISKSEFTILKQFANAVEADAMMHYETTARTISSYGRKLQETNNFNKNVAAAILFRKERHALGPVVEYLSMRLDADHILEDRIYSWFEKEFKILGWNSPRDMPAMALGTEFHIRNGESLIEIHKIIEDESKSIEKLKSLTTTKIKFIGEDPSKYQNLRELVNAYEKYYREHHPIYYQDILGDFFTTLKEEMAKKGL